MGSEETGTTASGSTSYKYQAVSGTKAWVNIQHAYSVAQDWSEYESITFYWYGQGTCSTFTLEIEAPTYSDRFTKSFKDDFTGWKKIEFTYSSFSQVGLPDWSKVKKILFVKGGNPENSWFIDSFKLEGTQTTTTTQILSNLTEILRWSSSGTYEKYSTISEYDGYSIAQETDVYMAWTWHKSAAEGIVANDKEIICYFNLAGRTKESGGYTSDWLLHDANGNEIYEKSFPQNFIVDPLNEDYRTYVVAWVQRRVNDGFTGIFWDNGFSPYAPTEYYWSTPAVNPRTGQLYTDEEWVRDTVDLLNYLKSKFPDMLMITNGGWSGNFYYEHYSGFQYFFENAQIEGLFSEGTFSNVQGMFWPVWQMERSFRMIADQQDKWLSKPGKLIVSHTYARNCGKYSQANVGVIGGERSAQFVYCCSIMGASSSTGNMVSLGGLMSEPTTQTLFGLDLGPSLGPYSKSGSTTYLKQFENFNLLVNVGSYAETVLVNGLEVTVEPLTGEILPSSSTSNSV
jgi:hypothetical protein